jgi:hypothetical protein
MFPKVLKRHRQNQMLINYEIDGHYDITDAIGMVSV